MRRTSHLLATILVLLIPAATFAQTAQPKATPTPQSKHFTTEELPIIVEQLDKEFFDSYNKCDLKKFRSMLDANVEFYHDKGGFSQGGDSLTESVRKNICNRVRRELVGKLEVYPIEKYGALEVGTHQFYENGNTQPSGEAKFMQLWQFTPDGWKLTRIFSVDHGPVRTLPPKK